MSDMLLPEPKRDPRSRSLDDSPPALRESREPMDVLHFPPADMPEEDDLVPQSMWYYKEIDLMKLFPMSRLYSMRRSIFWLCVTLCAVAASIALHRLAVLPPGAAWQRIPLFVVGIPAVILITRMLYWEFYRFRFSAKIDGFRIFVVKGVSFREYGSLPILPVSEIYIRRKPADFFFGMADVHITTCLDKTDRFACIEGLPMQHAEALQQFLSDQMSRQVAVADIPHVNKETGERTSHRRFYTKGDPGMR